MAVALKNQTQYIDFFQQAVLRAVGYWQSHAAIRQIDVRVLDRERETVLDVITRSLDLALAWPLSRTLISAFAAYMERRGHWGAWRLVLERAITTAQRVDDVDGETTMTALLARLSQRQSRPRDVVKYYRRVSRLAKRTGNRFEEARASSNLGYAYIDGGRWWRAEVLCLHALAIFEELGSAHGLAHTHNHLGLLYTRQYDWNNAEHHLKCACEIWESISDIHSWIYGLENLGLLYIEMNDAIYALKQLQKALVLVTDTGDEGERGTVLLNIGLAYLLCEDLINAAAYTQEAQGIFQKFANTIGQAQVLHNLGLIYFKQNHIDEAASCYIGSLDLYRNLNNVSSEINVLLDLVELENSRHAKSEAANGLKRIKRLIEHSGFPVSTRLRTRIETVHQSLANPSAKL